MASQLATVPHAPITVTNIDTGEQTTREPGTHFGLGNVTTINVEGRDLHIELGRYRWTFTCDDAATAERRARDFAIRAGR